MSAADAPVDLDDALAVVVYGSDAVDAALDARLTDGLADTGAASLVARLRDLLRTGDTVRAIEGVLSGTLALVADRLRHGDTFAEAVAAAEAAGFDKPASCAALAAFLAPR